MSERPQAGSRRWYRVVRRVGLPVGLVVLVVGAGWLGLAATPHAAPAPSEWDTKLIDVPPQVASKPVAVDSPGVAPAAVVIGVSFAGKHRAYPVAAMSDSISHVINDNVGGQPLTVVYCDRTNCARAFTARDRKSPLELAVGGWLNEGGVSDLLLRNGKYRYLLKTREGYGPDAPPFPFEEVQVELTSWGEWRAAHPDSELVKDWLPATVLNR